MKISVGIISLQAKIKTQDFPNSKQECQPFSRVLIEVACEDEGGGGDAVADALCCGLFNLLSDVAFIKSFLRWTLLPMIGCWPAEGM